MSINNPFPSDADRSAIWDMLMKRDFEAFVAADWSRVAADFIEDEFQGVDCGKTGEIDRWSLRYPDLASYRSEWLRQAEAFAGVELQGLGKLPFLYQATNLDQIEISGPRAMAHKKFAGKAMTTLGKPVELQWQTLYFLRQTGSRWKIAGFVGYLPLPRVEGCALPTA